MNISRTVLEIAHHHGTGLTILPNHQGRLVFNDFNKVSAVGADLTAAGVRWHPVGGTVIHIDDTVVYEEEGL